MSLGIQLHLNKIHKNILSYENQERETFEFDFYTHGDKAVIWTTLGSSGCKKKHFFYSN